MFIWRQNMPAKWGPRLGEISPYERILLKNQNLFTWKLILPPHRDHTFIKPGSRFGGVFFPTWTFRPVLQGRFCLWRAWAIFLKIADKHSAKNVIKTEVKWMSWLSIIYQKIVHKNENGACCDENNMGSKELAAVKIKGKTCFRWSAYSFRS